MLITLLRQLPPNGWPGLEGLMALLLGEQLGLQARPASAGPQGGRDVGLFDRASGLRKNIDIEVKRYSDGARPSRRMLFGELAETARDRPLTEQWILVCTCALPARLVGELQDQGFRDGFDVVVLDYAQGNLSLLEVLVASHPSVVAAWLSDQAIPLRARWTPALEEVRAHPAFAGARAGTRRAVVGAVRSVRRGREGARMAGAAGAGRPQSP